MKGCFSISSRCFFFLVLVGCHDNHLCYTKTSTSMWTRRFTTQTARAKAGNASFDSTLVFFINLIQLQSVTYTFVLMRRLLSEVQYQSSYTP